MPMIDATKWDEFYQEMTKDLKPYDHYDDGYRDAMDNADDWMDGNQVEAEPVRHGEWDSKYDEHDGFYHHFCTECKNLAIFAYDEQDDYDEGMDGEWYFLGKNIVGIKENLTDYCPNCGAKMRGESDE